MEMNLLAKIIYDNNLNDKQRKEIDSNSKSISSYKVQEVIHGKNRIENIFFLPLLYALDFRRNADNSGVETMAYYIKKNLKRSHGEEKFIMSLMYVLVSDDFEVEKVYKVINKKLNGIFKKKENIEYYEKFKEIVDYNWKFILFREKLRNKYKQK